LRYDANTPAQVPIVMHSNSYWLTR
jgi:hypothetical protein